MPSGEPPYSGRMERFERSGLTFDLDDAGPAGGETVVLLHGFPEDRTSWAQVTPILNGAGFRTLVPDQRGYSPGARPPHRRDYVLGECVADVLAMMDAAGVTAAHVVGHDWGGAVAWLLGGRHSARVRSLTTMATPHPAAMLRSMRTSTQALKSWYMLAFQLPWLPEAAIARSDLAKSLRGTGMPAEAAGHMAARMREPGAMTGALNWYRALPFGGRLPTPRSRVPTTYVWGSRDFALGRAAAEATADFVLADYRFVEVDEGHWLPEARPAEMAEIILARIGTVR